MHENFENYIHRRKNLTKERKQNLVGFLREQPTLAITEDALEEIYLKTFKYSIQTLYNDLRDLQILGIVAKEKVVRYRLISKERYESFMEEKKTLETPKEVPLTLNLETNETILQPQQLEKPNFKKIVEQVKKEKQELELQSQEGLDNIELQSRIGDDDED